MSQFVIISGGTKDFFCCDSEQYSNNFLSFSSSSQTGYSLKLFYVEACLLFIHTMFHIGVYSAWLRLRFMLSSISFSCTLHTYKYFVSVSIHLLFLSMRRQFTANLITMLMALSTLTAVIVPIILFRNNFALNSICVTLFLPNCIRWDCHVEPCDGNEYNGKRETREKLERKLWKMKNNLISCIKRQQKWAVPMNEKSTNETDKAREPKKCKVISWWEKEKLGGIAKSNNKKMVV